MVVGRGRGSRAQRSRCGKMFSLRGRRVDGTSTSDIDPPIDWKMNSSAAGLYNAFQEAGMFVKDYFSGAT